MKTMSTHRLPPLERAATNPLPPGAGLIVAAGASLLLWAAIAGVVAVV